jgi:hypothetical protein
VKVLPIYRCVAGWRSTDIYLNGVLMPGIFFTNYFYDTLEGKPFENRKRWLMVDDQCVEGEVITEPRALPNVESRRK